MSIKLVVAKAHKAHLEQEDARKELQSVEEELNKVQLDYTEGTVNFVFVKGIYQHIDRALLTVCVFVNKTDKPIKEIHGVMRLSFVKEQAVLAKATLDFDEEFLGVIQPDEGLLFHINIPAKGLKEDKEFIFSDITGSLDDVRVTYAE